MSETLPELRAELDLSPSPDPEHPGYVLRDPYGYTDAILLLPPLIASGLPYFDGTRTTLDLQAHLTRATGEIVPGETVRQILDVLRSNGFLQTEELEKRRTERQAEFEAAPVRAAIHAGSGYPADPADLAGWVRGILELEEDAAPGFDPGSLVGIAAPHVSPHGGARSYAAAYAKLKSDLAGRTFVILGTSHYGTPERFGLTRKPFRTPAGDAPVDLELFEELERRAGDAILLEDYCQAIEHSIEFQVLFLQQLVGKDVRILPVLCGPLLRSLLSGEPPETDPAVGTFFHALEEIGARHRDRIFWVLGIDLAHIGRRYGDPFDALAETGRMLDVRARDLDRLERVCAGDSTSFFERVKPDQDALRWCGFAPLYTFLQAVPEARGRVWNYEQWNIDPQSVVSFCAIGFQRP